MRKLSEILLEMRERRICQPLDGDSLECECNRGHDEKSCPEWFKKEFADFAELSHRNYLHWETGAVIPKPKNIRRLLTSLEDMPCKKRKRHHPELTASERKLLDELRDAVKRGPKPRKIDENIDNDFLHVLEALQTEYSNFQGSEEIDLGWAVELLRKSPKHWPDYKIPAVSRTICRFEENLREVGCNAQRLLKFSSIVALRAAAQVALYLPETKTPRDYDNGRIVPLIREASEEANELLKRKSGSLDNDQLTVLNDAIAFFDEALDDVNARHFNTISMLCDKICKIAAGTQKPDYFREILELTGLVAKLVPPHTLFAEPVAPEMIVLTFPALVEIGTSDNEVYLSELQSPIPSREQPVIKARMKGKFAIGRFPVTVDQYYNFCREAGRPLPKQNKTDDDQMPVVGVSWYDAKGYCSWLSERTAQPYRLPSEVEWEFACRACQYADTAYYYGDQIDGDDAVFRDTGLRGPVSTTARHFRPNGFGLYFMHGNLWEWCEDAFEEGYRAGRTQAPFEDQGNGNKAAKGGSWAEPAHMIRSASRLDVPPDTSNELMGFRVVRDLY